MQEGHSSGLKTNIQNSIFNFFHIKSKRYEENTAKHYNLTQLGSKSKDICYSVVYTFL